MDFDVTDIGYLWYCHQKRLGAGEISQMEILGAELQDCYHRFQPPPTYEAQKGWHDERVRELLGV